MGDGGARAAGEGVNQSHVLFDRFVQATTCKGTLKAFQELCDFLELKPNEYRVFYHKLKSKLNYWKAKALWAKLDKRASHKEYKKGRACANSKCLIIGAGPCGLRTAIELAFLGAKVVLLEKRDAFSRNNVLHLWPFTIQDLRGLGAKKFYGKFCAGSIDHISIRQLQLMLLKMALLLGIEIHVNAEFKGLIEPPEDQENERIGWRAEVHPRTHPVNELEFDVIIGADGRRNTLSGFRRKEFRGKLAIAITANFINRNTTAEAKVEEISGVAFIFNQKFFQDLREATGIDLENIVYYKDDTHYFVMTAKKQSLLEKGVILHDYVDTEMLLSRANVDQAALLSYAREAADFSTNHQLPTLDFAINHYGQPDVAMFDFTCMYASENAALIRQRNGHQLLVALVGDSLLEPFWPMGTGIARGFLAALDSAWMVRSWAQGASALEVLAERESIYRLLPQTTPENVSKNYSHYTVDPTTRYPNISLHLLRPNQVRHLIDTGENREIRIDMENVVNSSTPKLMRNELLLEKQLQESIARSSKLLNWCQRQTEGYRGVSVSDLTTSWKSGLALCALIHRYRPDLIDFESLDEKDVEKNNQLAFDVSEKEFGISPIMTGKEMSVVVEPDKLSMVVYLTQFYEMFKDTVPPGENHNLSPEEKAALIASTKSPISFLSKLGQSINISRKRNPKDKKEKEMDGVGKRRKTSQAGQSEDEELQQGVGNERSTALTERRIDTTAAANNNKVKSMATQLLAKFEENAPAQSTGLKRQGESMPNLSVLEPPSPPPAPLKESVPMRLAPVPAWRKRRTQLQEQMSFRYKERVKCQTLPSRGEQAIRSSDGLRSCPKKTILLSSSSPPSTSASSSPPLSPYTQSSDHKVEVNAYGEKQDDLGTSQDRFALYYREAGLWPEETSEPFQAPTIQEKAETLATKFTRQPCKADKPQPMKKPSHFFLEQWLLTHGLAPQQPTYFPDPQLQEIQRLDSDDQVPLHIPSIRERAERLTSLFKDKPSRPKPKKKPSRFFIEQWHRVREIPTDSPLPSPASLRQRYVRMYTGGVSSLAEQIASQLQTQDNPRLSLEKRDLGSLRKEFPQNIGGSDVCFFCRKRVYVMERLSAEGKFFHRSCFKCDYCGTTLRLSSYAFDVEDGKFYCKPHYCYRLSGQAQRKRPAPATAPLHSKEPQAPAVAPVTVDAPGRAAAAQAPAERRPSVPEVNGVGEPSLAKRLRGTPERIELENYRLSIIQREEELEEVPEETLAEHNLSSVLDKGTDVDDGSSSSESDMEEEDEELEPAGPSDLGGVPWKDAVEIHAKLKSGSDTGAGREDGEHREGEMEGEDEEDEEDEEEEEEEEEESSDEGEYCPWEWELQSGVWLENLTDEEETGTFKARNLKIDQVLLPVDPLLPQKDPKALEGDREGPSGSVSGSQPSLPSQSTQPTSSTAPSHTSARHEAVRAWLDSMSGEPCEEEDDPDAEAGSPDIEPGTELDEEDIPSDAEAEARSQRVDDAEPLPVDTTKPESIEHVCRKEHVSASPREFIVDVILSPIQKPVTPVEENKEKPLPVLVKSPGTRFFSEPFLPEDIKQQMSTVPTSPTAPIVLTPEAKSPKSLVAVTSPIRSQPAPLPETVTPKSPIQPDPCACSPSSNPLSPICAQPLPCQEPSSPLSTGSPVRTQPVPAVTSTPLVKPIPLERKTPESLKTQDTIEETPVKKADIIEEFWMKSAEIRRSLGLTPLDRSRSIIEKSKVSTPEPISPKSQTPEDLSEEMKPTFTGRSVIRRLNITLEGQVISPVEPKSNGSDRRELSTSSGLGLNGSTMTSQTATSDSYNNSDSTMLTPPSSPPPPPPNEEPATLTKKPLVTWDNLCLNIDEPKVEQAPSKVEKAPSKVEKTPSKGEKTPLKVEKAPSNVEKAPSKIKTPTSPPQTKSATTPVPAPRTNPPVVMRTKDPNKPRREEVRKSFVECVEEIPFADDVEDTYDDRTPDTSAQDRFYTPPTSKVNRDRGPPLHLALAMENGKPNIPGALVSRAGKGPQHFSPEAKEIAEERMREREKSVKSQALKDAMAKQLNKMKEAESAKGAVAKVAWNVSEVTVKNKKRSSLPKASAVKALESKKQAEAPSDRFFTSPLNKSIDSSVTSSESSTGAKSKKRSSLFSPRKNKKEKKAKNESRLSGTEETPPKHKSLWKAVFSGYKKDKKKKDDKSCPSTPSSSTTADSGVKKASPMTRSSDLRLRRNLSFSEDSDLSCDDVLERSSQKSKADRHMDLFDLVSDLKKDVMKEEKEKEKENKRVRQRDRVKGRSKEKAKEKGTQERMNEMERIKLMEKIMDMEHNKVEEESVYVPHALAFKRSYASKKTYTEEELNAKLTRRVQKAARRQAKQEELKRLHRAQIIQRQLEQVEEKQRQLEERGVAVEKALRGEAGLYKGSSVSPKQRKRRSDYWGESNYSEILDLHLGVEPYVGTPRWRPLSFCPCCTPEGMGKKDDPKLMQEWFKLVQEKNALVRYESELMIFARELELEDRQSRLQQELRERMAVDDHLKTETELAEEKQILNEMLEVVEQRDSLVALLEEQRLREKEEDKDLESVMLSKGFNLNWA
ncbi:protein-methionine sulfoxide oxidase mical3a isoform X7 [Astyanax mexicanus]|uniref:protein-methionine sulfoxide oxidase mical3a isoform X7 n=1 Tax=Astyanax mexicanus TaxID=7994 RepID=UPI0020CAB852|nr:protein-methionine sulfoxide oxidase mical3a isoform X7 [Astyanax mexicanus]